MNENLKKFHFFVDAKKFETDKHSLDGAEIKSIAGVNPTYQVFLEEEGDRPDRPISDGEAVEMREGEHIRHFYAVPPATFGVQ